MSNSSIPAFPQELINSFNSNMRVLESKSISELKQGVHLKGTSIIANNFYTAKVTLSGFYWHQFISSMPYHDFLPKNLKQKIIRKYISNRTSQTNEDYLVREFTYFNIIDFLNQIKKYRLAIAKNILFSLNEKFRNGSTVTENIFQFNQNLYLSGTHFKDCGNEEFNKEVKKITLNLLFVIATLNNQPFCIDREFDLFETLNSEPFSISSTQLYTNFFRVFVGQDHSASFKLDTETSGKVCDLLLLAIKEHEMSTVVPYHEAINSEIIASETIITNRIYDQPKDSFQSSNSLADLLKLSNKQRRVYLRKVNEK